MTDPPAPERPLRIAMISYYLPSSSKMGIGYQVHSLATELARRGHTVDVFSECPPVPGALYGHRHVQLKGAGRTFRFALALRKIDFSSYDVLHAHGDDYWLWRRRVGRHVRTLHGSCFEEARRIRGFKEKARMVLLGLSEVLATLVADVTVMVSPATQRWYPWVRTIVPNGVDTRRFSPDPAVRSAQPTVLFVGTWGGRKRGAELAQQFERVVLPEFPDAQLWMVTRDAPSHPGMGVQVFGEVSEECLSDLYRQAWVFCLPSDYEGFGIPYIEAMASGIAVVATPNLGARFVTEDGLAGSLVPLDEIGAGILSILGDDGRRSELEKRGVDRAGDFALGAVIDAYERIYRA